MRGLMMDNGLTINSLIEHTNKFHPNTEIVSRSIEGPIHRYTYAESYVRMNKLANALFSLGIKKGDRIGTLAWNGYRHFELFSVFLELALFATQLTHDYLKIN